MVRPHDLPEGDDHPVLVAAEGDGLHRPTRADRALQDGDRVGVAVAVHVAGVGGLQVYVAVARLSGQAGAVGVARSTGSPCGQVDAGGEEVGAGQRG